MFNPLNDTALTPFHPAAHGKTELPIVMLHIGGLYASSRPIKIRTVLGSCVSACLFDPSTGIGGANHIFLPGTAGDPDLSTCYGINAMEMLINDMMKLGAKRRSIRAKVFGGAALQQACGDGMTVGEMNVRFVEKFLETESIPIITRHTGGRNGLRLEYLPHRFEVLVKFLSMERFIIAEEKELSYREKITQELHHRRRENITLF